MAHLVYLKKEKEKGQVHLAQRHYWDTGDAPGSREMEAMQVAQDKIIQSNLIHYNLVARDNIYLLEVGVLPCNVSLNLENNIF